jgi:hypothetical protein
MEYLNQVAYEHRFWLSVLRDHAVFIYSSLAPDEKEDIQKAQLFIRTLSNLSEKSKGNLTDYEISNLTQQAIRVANDIRRFKLELLAKHLVGDIDIDLSPTFINHMINEVEEYLRMLNFLLNYQIPRFDSIHHHLIWLLDGVGHADSIVCSLDTVEEKLINRSKEFSKTFQKFYLKAVEMAGYMRTCIERFPALIRFNFQVENEMTSFMKFLKELEQLDVNKKALGTLMPILLDHMYREECYYLTKLSQVSEVKKPDCKAY